MYFTKRLFEGILTRKIKDERTSCIILSIKIL